MLLHSKAKNSAHPVSPYNSISQSWQYSQIFIAPFPVICLVLKVDPLFCIQLLMKRAFTKWQAVQTYWMQFKCKITFNCQKKPTLILEKTKFVFFSPWNKFAWEASHQSKFKSNLQVGGIGFKFPYIDCKWSATKCLPSFWLVPYSNQIKSTVNSYLLKLHLAFSPISGNPSGNLYWIG